jgi:hypothetical protein
MHSVLVGTLEGKIILDDLLSYGDNIEMVHKSVGRTWSVMTLKHLGENLKESVI